MTRQQLTEQTVAVWQPRLRRRLSNEDAREITENISGFFAILAEWSRQEERERADVTASGGADT
jgi:chemotaxis regulatin CheY-phosphate phosphatase CheZ